MITPKELKRIKKSWQKKTGNEDILALLAEVERLQTLVDGIKKIVDAALRNLNEKE